MLNSPQACRAAAAILVVLFHTSNEVVDLEKYFGQKRFGRAFDFGFAGVESAANPHLSLPSGSILNLMAEA